MTSATLAAVLFTAAPELASAAATIKLSPNPVRRGHLVTVSGTVGGGCPAKDQVTLISRAFVHAHDFAGVPAVFARVGPHGGYTVRTRIPAVRRLGYYSVAGRCGGGNLGAVAVLTVRP